MNSVLRLTILSAPLAAAVLLSGRRINEHKSGDKENVDIGTPFGSMHVDTNQAGDTSAIGLTVYPGAVPARQEDNKNHNNANVDLSFGDFHLGVKAASFQSSDAPEKVIAFYRQDLAKFGDVIACHGDRPIGTPTRTSQGLRCDDKHGNQEINDDSAAKGVHLHGTLNGQHIDTDTDLELRAGSEQRQHIVGIEPRDGGTRIGLVALNLPGNLGKSGGKPE